MYSIWFHFYKNLVSSTRYFSRVSGLVFLATTLWLLSYNPLKALKRSCLDLIDGQPPFKSVYTIWICDTNLLLWLQQEGGNARLDAVTLGDDAWAWTLSVRWCTVTDSHSGELFHHLHRGSCPFDAFALCFTRLILTSLPFHLFKSAQLQDFAKRIILICNPQTYGGLHPPSKSAAIAARCSKCL